VLEASRLVVEVPTSTAMVVCEERVRCIRAPLNEIDIGLGTLNEIALALEHQRRRRTYFDKHSCSFGRLAIFHE